MNHTEHRLDHMLDDWLTERFHAARDTDDAALLAQLQAEMASKVAAMFKRRFPPIMGAV